MKKIFFILIISFFFLFNFWVIAEAKDCDAGDLVCGGVAECEETATQDGCLADCSVGEGFGGWAWPKCDCNLKTEAESDCWCECNEQCADDWCKSLGRAKGICKDSKGHCCDATETNCDIDSDDEDCDGKLNCNDKEDCEGEICDTNKVCKNGACVEKKPACVTDCQQVTQTCLCGSKETEVESGEFCCIALSKRYTLKTDCEKQCEQVCPEDCDNLAPVPCYCDSKLIEVDEEKYCYGGKVYTEQEKCKEDEAAPPEEEKPPGFFVCPGDRAECPEGSFCIENPLCAETFEQLINAIVNFIFYIALAIAPIMFIIAGLAFITAAGDPAKIKTAKDIALWTAIGLIVVLLATGIIKVIQEIFSG
ncbi:MAG: pilin [Minisyncoccales bacterium]